MARPEDTLMESFINRGLGTSKLASRAIQQSNLPRLQAAIAESRAVQSTIKSRRLTNVKSQIIKDMQSRRGFGGRRREGEASSSGLQALGRSAIGTSHEGVAVAHRKGSGYDVRTLQRKKIEQLIAKGHLPKDLMRKLPEINTEYRGGGKPRSLAEIRQRILFTLK